MKRYLSGIDWVINTLDYLGRRRSGVGNISQIVLELLGRPEEKDLRKRLDNCLKAIPALSGYPKRAVNLCPYWKVSGRSYPLALNVYNLDNDSGFTEALSIFRDQLDKPFRNKREHLVFNLIYCRDKTYFGMVFDHRLIDARGAEAFLSMLAQEPQELSPLNSLEEPSNLNRWLDKFRSGRKINRVFLHLTAGKPRVLTLRQNSSNSRLSVFAFSAQESRVIADNSYKSAGYLMLMPYLLAKSIVCLHSIFEQRKILPADYLIPVSVDSRASDLVKQEPFFNHLSFFLFRIKTEEAHDFAVVLDKIRKQMYEQVKIGLPEAIKEASFLIRIAPLPLVDFFMRVMTKGETASFAFSFLGESVFAPDTFLGAKVCNLLHLPRIPLPPGLGIFFNQYQGRLNATLSSVKGLLSESEVKQVDEYLKGLA